MSYRRIAFAVLTFATLLFAGMFHWGLYQRSLGIRLPLWTWSTAAGGLWYAGSLFGIMLTHELGHLAVCKRYRLPTSGPYFLPVGFPMIGTFGAFLRVHQPYPSRAVLLRVGLAGPLAGFLLILPLLYLGLSWSHGTEARGWPAVVRFGTPWIMSLMGNRLIGPAPWILHPMATAAWVGLLFTMLNLIPFRQFDGGHIVRGAFGPKVGLFCSVTSFLTAIYLATRSLTWAMVAIVMALDWHPIDKPLEDDRPNFRWGFVAVAVVLFALCWNQIELRR